MAPNGVPLPRPPDRAAELAEASAAGAMHDVTASAAAQVSAAGAPRAAGVLQAAAPSPRAREVPVVNAEAVRLEAMGGGAARGQAVIGERMSAGERVRVPPMTAAARRGEPTSAGPGRGGSERNLGRSGPGTQRHRMLARAGPVEPNPRR